MSERWYYQMLMEEFGPVTEREILQLLRDQMLSPTDLVRRESAAEWIAASEVPFFAEDGDRPEELEELSDLSELSFEFEDRPARKPVDRSGRSAPQQRQTPREISPASGYPPSVSQSAANLTEQRYYCQSLGEVMGPMPLEELIAIAESGSLDDTDLVREGDFGVWKPSISIPEVAAAVIQAIKSGSRDAPAPVRQQPYRLQDHGPREQEVRQSEDTEDQDAAATAGARGESTEAKTAGEGKPKGKSRKRRLKQVSDEQLGEIFDEIFTDDGKRREPSPVQASGAGIPQMAPVPIVPHGVPDGIASPSGPVEPAYSAGQPVAQSAAYTPPRPATTFQPPKPAAKKSSGGGGGFSFNYSGQTVGMVAGGILAVVLIGGVVMGKVSVPFVGAIFRPDPSKALGTAHAAIKAVNVDSVDEKGWKTFQRSLLEEVGPALNQLVSTTAPDEVTAAKQKAGKKMMALAYLKFKDKEKIKKTMGEIDEMMAAIK